jgi:hypothetical protein
MRLKAAQNNFTNSLAIMDKKSGQIITRIGSDIQQGLWGAPLDFIDEIVTIMLMEIEAFYGDAPTTDEANFVMRHFKNYIGYPP